MFDRDNAAFQVNGLTFWKRKNLNAPLSNTLVDGVSNCMHPCQTP